MYIYIYICIYIYIYVYIYIYTHTDKVKANMEHDMVVLRTDAAFEDYYGRAYIHT